MNVTLLSILIVCFFSCQTDKVKISNANISIRDTIVKDLPKSGDGRINGEYLIKDEIEAKAGLNNLEAGFDSVYIRIWYSCSFDKAQVIELKCQNDEWTAEKYNLTYHFYNDTDSILRVTKELQKGVPKSGWKSFIKQIYDLDVLSLPSFQSIPQYNLSMDSRSVNVQIATKTKYRMYIYPSLSYYAKKIPEANKMYTIMELIEKELKFKRLCDL